MIRSNKIKMYIIPSEVAHLTLFLDQEVTRSIAKVNTPSRMKCKSETPTPILLFAYVAGKRQHGVSALSKEITQWQTPEPCCLKAD